MGRWPPAPWAGPCCTQSCERRSTWREPPRWESEATSRQLKCLGTCFFHLFTCWFAATYSPWPAWHNKQRGIRHRSWKEWVHGQNRNNISEHSEISSRNFSIYFWHYNGSEWSDRTWPRCPWREGMERETRRSRRCNWNFAINIQYIIDAICKQFYILSGAL